MTLGFQARALLRGLARTGEPALLRGVDAGNVNIAHNVDVYAGQLGTADDNMMVRYTVVTIDKAMSPRVGDDLTFVDEAGDPIADQTYVLDKPVADNGITARYIVSKA